MMLLPWLVKLMYITTLNLKVRRKVEPKKFVFCSPVTLISKIHKYRPYFELPHSTQRLGFKPFLIIGKLDFDYDGPVNVIETGTYSDKHFDVPKTLPLLLRFIKREKPDVFVFFHMNLILPFLVIASKLFLRHHKIKFIIKMDWDGSEFKELGKLMLLRNILLMVESFFVDKLIIENTCGLRTINSIPFMRKKKVMLLPNTYSESLIQRLGYRDRPRSSIILVVSRISPEKGIEVLISAFGEISSEFPDWSVVVVGPTADYVYLEKLRDLIKSMRLSRRIKFLGPLYDEALRDEYYKASIFCLPSNQESFAISRMEAIAAGLPLITSEVGCGKDFEKMGSMIFRVGDTEGLKSHLRKLISSDELRSEIAEKQQAHLLTYEQIAEKLISSLV